MLDNGNNDTPETAQEVAVPCEIAGHIEKPRDRDWYTFTAKKGERLQHRGPQRPPGAPTYMYFMLKNDKSDLKESDDNQDILSRKFYARSEDPQPYRFVAPADGKYQLMVSSRLADTLAEPRHLLSRPHRAAAAGLPSGGPGHGRVSARRHDRPGRRQQAFTLLASARTASPATSPCVPRDCRRA